MEGEDCCPNCDKPLGDDYYCEFCNKCHNDHKCKCSLEQRLVLTKEVERLKELEQWYMRERMGLPMSGEFPPKPIRSIIVHLDSNLIRTGVNPFSVNYEVFFTPEGKQNHIKRSVPHYHRDKITRYIDNKRALIVEGDDGKNKFKLVDKDYECEENEVELRWVEESVETQNLKKENEKLQGEVASLTKEIEYLRLVGEEAIDDDDL